MNIIIDSNIQNVATLRIKLRTLNEKLLANKNIKSDTVTEK